MTLRDMMNEASPSLTFVRKGDRANMRCGNNQPMNSESTWVTREAVYRANGEKRAYSLVSIREDIARSAFGRDLKACRFQFALDPQAEAFYIFADPNGFKPQSGTTRLTVRLQSKRLPRVDELENILFPSASVVTIEGMTGVRVDLRNQPIKWAS
jgi:hypothetical protein